MNRGIQALVINAYDLRKGKSMEMYTTFRKMLVSLLGKQSLLIEKNADDLADYVFDWEFELLGENTKTIAKRFDKVDMVFLAGDTTAVPWEKKFNDLTMLLHMCNFVKKPVVAVGSGAFHALYALCTKGARFDVINGPIGNQLDRLPSYGEYANGSEAHPSGWLDNETGDMYCFDKRKQSWIPLCCVGVTRVPTHGLPAPEGLKQPVRKYARNDRRLNEQPDVQASGSGEDIVQFRVQAQQHFLTHKLPLPKFALCLPPGWIINSDGGLPSDAGIFILADGTNGPVLFTFDNCLVLAAEIRIGNTYNVVRQMIKNFVREIITRYQGESPSAAPAMHFMDKLFGPGGNGGAVLEPIDSQDRALAPSLAASIVPTLLTTGPKKVPSMFSPRAGPQKDVVAQPGAADHVDYTALLSPRTHTTLGKKTPVAQKKESNVRSKRLDIFLASQGHADMQPLNKKAALLAQKMQGQALDGFDSARRIFDERMLRPSPLHKEETFQDNQQQHPPNVRFDRPTSAGHGRWAGGRDNKYLGQGQDRSRNGHLCGLNDAKKLDTRRAHEQQREGRPSTADPVSRNNVDVGDHFLPRCHPVRKVRIPELVDKRGNKIPQPAAKNQVPERGEFNSQSDVPKPSQSTVILQAHSILPFSNHKKYEELAKAEALAEAMREPYEGIYTEPYRSEHEKFLHEYTMSKQKFLGGTFYGYSGIASQIPLRPSNIIGSAASLEQIRDKVKEKLEKNWRK